MCSNNRENIGANQAQYGASVDCGGIHHQRSNDGQILSVIPAGHAVIAPPIVSVN